MARGRHVRETGLLVWLFATGVSQAPDRLPQPSWRSVHAHSLVLLHDEVGDLRSALADLRVEQDVVTVAAVSTEGRLERLEEQLSVSQDEVAALRAELAALREELVWAFAEQGRTDAPAVLRAPRPVASAG